MKGPWLSKEARKALQLKNKIWLIGNRKRRKSKFKMDFFPSTPR